MLGVEGPVVDQELHGNGIVAIVQTLFEVKLMRALERIDVELDAESWLLRNLDLAILDLERIFGELLAFLPNPVGVNGGDFPRSCSSAMRKHRQGDVKMIVGV